MNEVWNEGTAFLHVKYYYGEADASTVKLTKKIFTFHSLTIMVNPALKNIFRCVFKMRKVH